MNPLFLPATHAVGKWTKSLVRVSAELGKVSGSFSALPRVRLVQIMEAVTVMSKSAAGDRTLRGAIFEAAIHDALLRCGVPFDCLFCHMKDATHSLEVDIVVGHEAIVPCVWIFAKTSARERWKEVDRDAYVLSQNGMQSWNEMIVSSPLRPLHKVNAPAFFILFKEHPTTPAVEAIRLARKIGQRSFGMAGRVFSIYDAERWDDFVATVKKAIP